MTELDAALVRRKLAVIRRNLEDPAAVESLSLDEYRADRFRMNGTERLLQETAGGATPMTYLDATSSRRRLRVLALARRAAASSSRTRKRSGANCSSPAPLR